MSRETSSQTELPELPVKTPGAHSCVETSAEIREKARILEEQREERKKASGTSCIPNSKTLLNMLLQNSL